MDIKIRLDREGLFGLQFGSFYRTFKPESNQIRYGLQSQIKSNFHLEENHNTYHIYLVGLDYIFELNNWQS